MSSILNQIKALNGPNKESEDLILSLIDTNPSQILSMPQIYKYLIETSNVKALVLLDRAAQMETDLRELNEIFINTKAKILVDYFPNQDRFDADQNSEVLPGAYFRVDDEKKNLYKRLSQDSEFKVTLQFELDLKRGLIQYQVTEQSMTSTIVDRLMSKPAMSIAIAAAICLSSVAGYQGMKSVTDNKNTTQQSVRIDSSFEKIFGDAVHEIEKLDHAAKLISSINDLGSEELEYINDLNSGKDLSEIQEKYHDIISSQINDLITNTQKERLMYKTQKKVQSPEKIRMIANEIIQVSIDNEIDYRILTSIIMQESKFDQGATSSSGDVAMAQINYEIWKPEFDKKGLALDKEQLKKDETYALWAMGVVLSTIKDRHGSDPYWYARYHSNTKSRKAEYASLVNEHFYDFNKKQIEIISAKLDIILDQLKSTSYKDQFLIDSSKIDKFANKVIQMKTLLSTQDVPSRITTASN